MLETHDLVMNQKHLPHVGQTVKSKKFGTLWRVIEEKEIWENVEKDPVNGQPRMIPAIEIAYRRIKEGEMPGTGKMLKYAYTLHDNTFDVNWEMQ